MKLFCKGCGHRCHCLGKGYYVSETFCEGPAAVMIAPV
jgi:hypothetical protein